MKMKDNSKDLNSNDFNTIVIKQKELKNQITKIITTANKKIEKLNVELNNINLVLEDKCEHKGEIQIIDEFIEGTYYDRCRYIKKYYCTICSKLLKTTETTGGYG